MFDVSWSDPTRETVGQRKNRKAREVGSISRATSANSSRSEESTPQAKSSLLDFLAPKKQPLSRAGSQARPSLRVENTKTKRLSNFTISSEPDTFETTEPTTVRKIPTSIFNNGGSYHSEAENSTSSEVSDSIFSGRTSRSTKADSTWSSVDCTTSPRSTVQPLDASSFVSQSSSVTVSPRESVNDAERVATVVHITPAGTVPIQVHDSISRRSAQLSTFDFPLPSRQERTPTPNTYRPDLSPSPQPTIQSFSLRPKSSTSEPYKNPNLRTLPPTLPPTAPLPLSPASSRRSSNSNSTTKSRPLRPQKPSAEFLSLQRSIRRMEAASSKIMLERLKEEWIEAADASIYRELELEKQLWMLTALRKKFGKGGPEYGLSSLLPGGAKILSLFENQASTSTLSALSPPPTEIHHLSPTPLSPRLYPNIHPLPLSPTTTHLPYPSNTFSSIQSFSLPSLLPAVSIPVLLRECSRVLISASPPPLASYPINIFPPTPITSTPITTTPNLSIQTNMNMNIDSPTLTPQMRGEKDLIPELLLAATRKPGTLHLTLLDPSPVASTLGPKMREWLDNNLLINLETQFRCLNSLRLFPLWLAQEGLRGEGSTIQHVSFLACYIPSSSGLEAGKGGGNGKYGDGRGDSEGTGDEETRIELKSVVGRMLWKEIWGPWVLGEKWWWEDEGVVTECREKGTRWEYAVVVGVKEG